MDQNKEERKETATDWLFRQLWETPKDRFQWYALLEKAEKMHKDQIIDSWEAGGPERCCKYDDPETGEQYYTQTFQK
jgi:hypothetical protein